MCLHNKQLTWKLGTEELHTSWKEEISFLSVTVGKYPRNKKHCSLPPVLCCRQEGRGSWGDRREWQQPDLLDIPTSDAPSHLQLCCSHHRLPQSTLSEQRWCTDNVHILQLFNLVLSLSTFDLNKSLALKSFNRSDVKDDGTSSTS